MKTALVTIYRATAPNGRCYVGQTKHWPRRKHEHIKAAQAGRHANQRFARALLKYGDAMKWEVVAKVIPEWADQAEINAILASGAMSPKGYNLREGGVATPMTDSTKKKIAARLSGREFSPEHRAKLSATKRGRKLTTEHRENIGKGGRGRKYTPQARENIAAANRKTANQPERRTRLSAASKRRWGDPAYRASHAAKISDAHARGAFRKRAQR